MDISHLSAVGQVALAQIRVALADIAPEITESEVIPTADFFADLGLDLVGKWALAFALERITKTEITDQKIHAAKTVQDFIDLISASDVTNSLVQSTQQNSAATQMIPAQIKHGKQLPQIKATPSKTERAVDTAEPASSCAVSEESGKDRLATAADLAALLK